MDESVRRYLSEPKRRGGSKRSPQKSRANRIKSIEKVARRKREYLELEREIWRKLALKNTGRS
jgi:hypothetical protein